MNVMVRGGFRSIATLLGHARFPENLNGWVSPDPQFHLLGRAALRRGDLSYEDDGDGQASSGLHLQRPVTLVVLDDGGKRRALAHRNQAQDGGMRRPRGLLAQLDQVLDLADRTELCVDRHGTHEQEVWIRIYAHVVAVLGNRGIAQGVVSRLDGLPAEVRSLTGEVQDAYQLAHTEGGIDRVGTAR